MAKFVLKDASVVWNSVDLSDHVETVTINATIDIPETTSMGDNARTRIAGLLDGTVDITFRGDFAASNVDATFYPDHYAGTARVLVIKPTSAAVSATNPTYTMTGLVGNIVPIGNTVGDVAAVTVTITNSANTGIVRATS